MQQKTTSASDLYSVFKNLYSGYEASMHDYTRYTPTGLIPCRLMTTNPLKTIGEDWATLIVGEELSITTGYEFIDDYIKEVFIPHQSEFIEQEMVIGQGFIQPFMNEFGAPQFNMFIGNEFKVEQWYFDRPSIIVVEYNEYDMILRYSVELDQVDVSYEAHEKGTGVELPDAYSFAGQLNYFKPNIANNKTFTRDGISVAANSLDIIRFADTTFTDRFKEFELSRKRVFIDASLTRREVLSKDGKTKEVEHYFDPEDQLYQATPDIKAGIEVYDTDIRVDAYVKNEAHLLIQLGDSCGLKDYYQLDPAGRVKPLTATQVISNKGDLFRNKSKHQKILSKEYKLVIKAFCSLMGTDIDLADITIDFDDSIITDDNADFERDLKLFDEGLMSAQALMKKHRKLTDQEVAIELKLIEQATVVDAPDVDPDLVE